MSSPLSIETKTALRPRYTLLMPKVAFAFSNHATVPFKLLRKMQWNEQQGFVELLNLSTQPFAIYTLIDWYRNRTGSVYQVPRTRLRSDYYLWMYDAVLGSDKQPHVRLCYWIELL